MWEGGGMSKREEGVWEDGEKCVGGRRDVQREEGGGEGCVGVGTV